MDMERDAEGFKHEDDDDSDAEEDAAIDLTQKHNNNNNTIKERGTFTMCSDFRSMVVRAAHA
jgi:hypothetical protein